MKLSFDANALEQNTACDRGVNPVGFNFCLEILAKRVKIIFYLIPDLF